MNYFEQPSFTKMTTEIFHFLLQLLILGLITRAEVNFTYNGFQHADLSLNGSAYVRSNGILTVTESIQMSIGHAFHPSPLLFKDSKPAGNNPNNKSSVLTFSTNFVFSINPKYPDLGGHGFAFVLLSTIQPNGCLPSQYFGLPNYTNNAPLFPTRMLAVEFDIVQNFELLDINSNHVGIDISSLISSIAAPAAYYLDNTTAANNSIDLQSGYPFHVWIDYDSQEELINVTIAPLGISRPYQPLLSLRVDLSAALDEYMFAGFSASTGMLSAACNVMGWSFRIGGLAQDLDPTSLPYLGGASKVIHQKGFAVGMTLACLTLVFLVTLGLLYVLRKIRNTDEILEDWEVEYGAHRFKYAELVTATRGFSETTLIGSGGFGKVYKGRVPRTGLEVAIKRIAQDSGQGMREFVAEITSMGRLRHRNLVQLHGWCRRQDDLFLVYDYVPNGSLDNLLFDNPELKKKVLTWDQRYKILIGIAQALLYLHDECEFRVIHRDVKPSNVLIDADLNAKLGDFGLSRTYEHGIHPKTTYIIGTLGYLAPEFTRTGRATTNTDVYSCGILMLEVVSGRRSIDPQKNANEILLVDWVRELHSQGEILQAIDPTLDEYDLYEAKLVLGLGLLCSNRHPVKRPSMRRVVQALLGDNSFPGLPSDLHLEDPAAVINYSSDVYADDTDPSCTDDRPTSSSDTSFSSFDHKRVSHNQARRLP